MYSIQDVSSRTGLSAHTLRYYEKEGLLPDVERTPGGFRQYSDADLERLGLICCLKNTGMSIQEIARFVQLTREGDRTLEERVELLYAHREQVLARMAEMQKHLDKVTWKLNFFSEKYRAYEAKTNGVPDESSESVPARAAAEVRFAREEDLARVNELRRQVNDLHVAGKPEVFKPGFCDELRDYIYAIWEDPRKEIVVAGLDGRVCGFAVLNHIVRPENPFMFERDYLDIDEFGVDEDSRRKGVASAMVSFIRDYARQKGFRRLELNMWEFNRGALAFYEAAGFTTYRRYMEINP